METISKQLKDTLRNTMQDKKIYSNEAIRQLIFENTGMKYGEDYKESHFAGCLSALKRNNEIIQVQRGEYKRGAVKRFSGNNGFTDQETRSASEKGADTETSMLQIKKDILLSVKRELAYLKSVTKNIVLSFDTPGEEIQYMLKVKELIGNLEDFEGQTDL